MKKLFFLLALVAAGHNIVLSQSCLPEGIVFETQAQIDSFQVNYPGCTEIEGDVQIGVSTEFYNITNLNGLSVLTSIGGDLTIFSNYALISLTGLDNLASVGGDLTISCNYALTNLMGLNNLTYIGERLRIYSNLELINLEGLEGLTSIIGTINISGNFYALTNLKGLDNLTSIGGDFEISNENALTSLTGLEKLTSIGGYLSIGSNPALTSLSVLGNLVSIGGLSIGYNDVLTSLTGLEGLTSIGGDLGIWDNYSLTNLTGLDNVTSIGGDFEISNENALTSLTGLEKLTSIGGELFINGTEILTSLTGLEGLTSIGESDGLGLVIVDNTALTCLTGLDNLTSVSGSLIIGNSDFGGNPALTSLTGLEGLTSAGGDLSIEYNDALYNLTGLEGLTSIGGDLYIENNDALTSLRGLDNIDAGTIDSLYIYHNSLLFSCEVQSICNYLASLNGRVDIYNNSTGCNSAIEIAHACGISSPCLPYGNYYFSSQADVDNFQAIYPNCSELEGDMTINGNDITNLDELSVVTSIGEDLEICHNDTLTSLTGLEGLTFIGGDLRIWWNEALTSLTGLEGLNSIGGNLKIGELNYGNPVLTSLTGLDNIDAESIVNLYIICNYLLSACEVQSICNYLASPNGFILISANTTGCNNQSEVWAACESIGLEEVMFEKRFTVFPNPFSHSTSFEYQLEEDASVTLTIFNLTGQEIAVLVNEQQTKGTYQLQWNAEDMPAGVYFYRLSATVNSQLSTGKVVIVK